jgi:predicted nucleic acid-binding protein
MLYVDSAVLVSLHCEETTTASIRRWMTKQKGPWFSSEWVVTECVSAFGLKVRRKELSSADATVAVDAIESLVADSFEFIPITPDHYSQARSWLREFQRPLRAADALHLAIALKAKCRLATYDDELLLAAKMLKVASTRTLA